MTAHENTHQTLIARVRDQYDESSWNEFVGYYEKYIYTVVCRLGLSHHDALDLVQNILLLLWKNLQNFDYQPEKCKFRSWMNKVIRNEVAGFFRKSGSYKDKLASVGELGDFKEEEEPRVEQGGKVVRRSLQICVCQIEVTVLDREVQARQQRKPMVAHHVAHRKLSQPADTVERVKAGVCRKDLRLELNLVLFDFDYKKLI